MVDERGNITRIEAVGKRAGFGLDEEALRVISKRSTWQHGLQAGRPVKVRLIVPVFFKMVK